MVCWYDTKFLTEGIAVHFHMMIVLSFNHITLSQFWSLYVSKCQKPFFFNLCIIVILPVLTSDQDIFQTNFTVWIDVCFFVQFKLASGEGEGLRSHNTCLPRLNFSGLVHSFFQVPAAACRQLRDFPAALQIHW